MDHDIVFEYRYELVVGSLDEIRARAKTLRPAEPPAWVFANDRQGWHYQNAQDSGWPIHGALDVKLAQNDPQLISPLTFWRAEDAPWLIIEAAFKTAQKSAAIFWQRHGESVAKESVNFAVTPDGEFHRYAVKLADSPAYTGGMVRLRFDPVGSGSEGEWVKVKSIKLSRDP